MANKGAVMTKLKGGRLLSPAGTARYAYLGKPDDSTYGKGRFRLTIVFDKQDPEFVAFAKKVAALSKLHDATIGRKATGLPIKLVDEKMSKGKDGKSGTGDPIGAPCIELVMNGKNPQGEENNVPVFNVQGVEESLYVYGGDIVRANLAVMGWAMPDGVGVKGYLNSVQLLKSNWSGNGGGFSDMSEEYVTEDAEGAEESGEGLPEEGEGFGDMSAEAEEEKPKSSETEVDPLDELLG